MLRNNLFAPVLLAALLLGLARLPLHTGFLVFFCLVPLFAFLQQRPSRRATVVAGFLFSAVYTLTSLHWRALTAKPADVPTAWELPMGVGIPFGLILLFGSYFALLFLLLRLAWRSRARFWLLAGLWLGFEWVQNWGEFRFPWHNLGYALAPYTVLLQPAELGGVYLVSLLAIAVNVLLWGLWKGNRRRSAVLLAALAVLWVGYGVWRMQALPLVDTGLNVGMVQASIPQDDKWDPMKQEENYEQYRQATRQLAANGAQLVVWPESALTLPPLRPDYAMGRLAKEQLDVVVREDSITLFTGFPHFANNDLSDPLFKYKPFLYYNACSQVHPNGSIDEPYYKIALVPFGERMPLLGVIPALWKVQLGQANFEYGRGPKFYTVQGVCYSPLVCFEMALPSITCAMARGGAHFIVNITNDGWFGRSAGAWQHSRMSIFRAIETRRPVFRAANCGISLIVQPTGRITDSAGLFVKKEMQAPVRTVKYLTPYCRGGYLLPSVAGVLGLLGTIITALFRRRKTAV